MKCLADQLDKLYKKKFMELGQLRPTGENYKIGHKGLWQFWGWFILKH